MVFIRYVIDKSSLSQIDVTQKLRPIYVVGICLPLILNTDVMELEDDRVCREAPGKSSGSASYLNLFSLI